MSRTCAMLTVLLLTSLARGDGGAVVARQTLGDESLVVLVSPVPPTAGEVEFSCLRSVSGMAISSLPIHVEALGPAGERVTATVTEPSDKDRFMQSCVITLRPHGTWQISVTLGPGANATTTFTLEIAPAPAESRSLLPWMFAFVPAALLVVIRERLAAAQRRARGAFVGAVADR